MGGTLHTEGVVEGGGHGIGDHHRMRSAAAPVAVAVMGAVEASIGISRTMMTVCMRSVWTAVHHPVRVEFAVCSLSPLCQEGHVRALGRSQHHRGACTEVRGKKAGQVPKARLPAAGMVHVPALHR